MTGPGSVTVWLDHLKAGRNRDEVVGQLWERYFTQLVEHARRHLRSGRAAVDGEDVALSAFDGFIRAVRAGTFPKLGDRGDLWQVLLMLTANKARNAVRDENRLKRGGAFVAHEIATADSVPGGVPVASPDADPAEAAVLAEGAERLLAALGNAELRRVAELALAGHTNADIAAAIGKAVASVERKLKRIRETWLALGFE